MLPIAPETISTEFEKEQDNVLDSTAVVEHWIEPDKYSNGLVLRGFHLGNVTLIKPPAGISWVGLNLTSREVAAPTT